MKFLRSCLNATALTRAGCSATGKDFQSAIQPGPLKPAAFICRPLDWCVVGPAVVNSNFYLLLAATAQVPGVQRAAGSRIWGWTAHRDKQIGFWSRHPSQWGPWQAAPHPKARAMSRPQPTPAGHCVSFTNFHHVWSWWLTHLHSVLMWA